MASGIVLITGASSGIGAACADLLAHGGFQVFGSSRNPRQRGSGVIVNVSSLGGIFGLPFQSFYSASKFALEGWTESLQDEVRAFGIRVALVEPGDVRTGFTGSRTVVAANASSAYAGLSAKCLQIVEAEERQGVGAEAVAHRVYGIVDGRANGLRYTRGHLSQRLAVPLKSLVPSRMFQPIIASFYGLGR